MVGANKSSVAEELVCQACCCCAASCQEVGIIGVVGIAKVIIEGEVGIIIIIEDDIKEVERLFFTESQGAATAATSPLKMLLLALVLLMEVTFDRFAVEVEPTRGVEDRVGVVALIEAVAGSNVFKEREDDNFELN